jgi:hypothetical protein
MSNILDRKVFNNIVLIIVCLGLGIILSSCVNDLQGESSGNTEIKPSATEKDQSINLENNSDIDEELEDHHNLQVLSIALDIPEIQSDDFTIIGINWSQDSSSINIAIAENIGADPLIWYSYSIESGEFDRSTTFPSGRYWSPYISYYQDLKLLISPSGKFEFLTIKSSDSDSELISEIDLYFTDVQNQTKIPLFEKVIGRISKVEWSTDENIVLFGFGYEGPIELFLSDISRGTTLPLSDLIEIEGYTDQDWSLSPAGNTIAFVKSNGLLSIIDLTTQEIQNLSVYANYLNWSPDGELIYFWAGDEFGEKKLIMAYDVKNDTEKLIMEKHELQQNDICLTSCSFAISNNQDLLVIWEKGQMWIIEVGE